MNFQILRNSKIFLLLYLFLRLFVTVRKAINQRCSESNGLPKNEDTKLKKKNFLRETQDIYITNNRVRYIFRIYSAS